jgi:hypothetical protein
MAFSTTGWAQGGDISKGVGGLHVYRTADNQAVVEGAGYFNSIQSNIQTGDVVLAIMGDTTLFYQLTNTAGVITFATLTDGTNDCVFA